MKHTIESKRKLSEARKRYLSAHPEKAAWKTHDKFRSIPCEKFKEYLKSQGIKFIPEFQPMLDQKRFFSIDVAFPDKKIGIEINGRQHYDGVGGLAPYYEKRHQLIESCGWKLYEVPYHVAFIEKRMKEVVDEILKSPTKVAFDFDNYVPKMPRPPRIPKPRIPIFKYDYPSIDKIKEMLNSGLNALQLANQLGIKYKAFHRFLSNNGIRTRIPRKLTRSEIDPHWRSAPRPSHRKIARPPKEELHQLVHSISIMDISKRFGTTDNNIRRWCKSEGIAIPIFPKGYWLRRKEGDTHEQAMHKRQPKVRKFHFLSEEEKNTIKELHESGSSAYKIGKILNRATKTIMEAIDRLVTKEALCP